MAQHQQNVAKYHKPGTPLAQLQAYSDQVAGSLNSLKAQRRSSKDRVDELTKAAATHKLSADMVAAQILGPGSQAGSINNSRAEIHHLLQDVQGSLAELRMEVATAKRLSSRAATELSDLPVSPVRRPQQQRAGSAPRRPLTGASMAAGSALPDGSPHAFSAYTASPSVRQAWSKPQPSGVNASPQAISIPAFYPDEQNSVQLETAGELNGNSIMLVHQLPSSPGPGNQQLVHVLDAKMDELGRRLETSIDRGLTASAALASAQAHNNKYTAAAREAADPLLLLGVSRAEATERTTVQLGHQLAAMDKHLGKGLEDVERRVLQQEAQTRQDHDKLSQVAAQVEAMQLHYKAAVDALPPAEQLNRLENRFAVVEGSQLRSKGEQEEQQRLLLALTATVQKTGQEAEAHVTARRRQEELSRQLEAGLGRIQEIETRVSSLSSALLATKARELSIGVNGVKAVEPHVLLERLQLLEEQVMVLQANESSKKEQSAIRAVEDRCMQLEAQLSAQQAASSRHAALEVLVQGLVARVGGLEQHLSDSNTTNLQLNSQLRASQHQAEQNLRLQEQLDRQQAVLSSLSSQHATQAARVANLESELQAARDALGSMVQKKVHECQAAVAGTVDQLADVTAAKLKALEQDQQQQLQAQLRQQEQLLHLQQVQRQQEQGGSRGVDVIARGTAFMQDPSAKEEPASPAHGTAGPVALLQPVLDMSLRLDKMQANLEQVQDSTLAAVKSSQAAVESAVEQVSVTQQALQPAQQRLQKQLDTLHAQLQEVQQQVPLAAGLQEQLTKLQVQAQSAQQHVQEVHSQLQSQVKGVYSEVSAVQAGITVQLETLSNDLDSLRQQLQVQHVQSRGSPSGTSSSVAPDTADATLSAGKHVQEQLHKAQEQLNSLMQEHTALQQRLAANWFVALEQGQSADSPFVMEVLQQHGTVLQELQGNLTSDVTDLSRQYEALAKQVASLQLQQPASGAMVPATGKGADVLDTADQGQQAAIAAAVEGLQAAVQQLQGDVEQQGHASQQFNSSLQDTSQQLEQISQQVKHVTSDVQQALEGVAMAQADLQVEQRERLEQHQADAATLQALSQAVHHLSDQISQWQPDEIINEADLISRSGSGYLGGSGSFTQEVLSLMVNSKSGRLPSSPDMSGALEKRPSFLPAAPGTQTSSPSAVSAAVSPHGAGQRAVAGARPHPDGADFSSISVTTITSRNTTTPAKSLATVDEPSVLHAAQTQPSYLDSEYRLDVGGVEPPAKVFGDNLVSSPEPTQSVTPSGIPRLSTSASTSLRDRDDAGAGAGVAASVSPPHLDATVMHKAHYYDHLANKYKGQGTPLPSHADGTPSRIPVFGQSQSARLAPNTSQDHVYGLSASFAAIGRSASFDPTSETASLTPSHTTFQVVKHALQSLQEGAEEQHAIESLREGHTTFQVVQHALQRLQEGEEEQHAIESLREGHTPFQVVQHALQRLQEGGAKQQGGALQLQEGLRRSAAKLQQAEAELLTQQPTAVESELEEETQQPQAVQPLMTPSAQDTPTRSLDGTSLTADITPKKLSSILQNLPVDEPQAIATSASSLSGLPPIRGRLGALPHLAAAAVADDSNDAAVSTDLHLQPQVLTRTLSGTSARDRFRRTSSSDAGNANGSRNSSYGGAAEAKMAAGMGLDAQGQLNSQTSQSSRSTHSASTDIVEEEALGDVLVDDEELQFQPAAATMPVASAALSAGPEAALSGLQAPHATGQLQQQQQQQQQQQPGVQSGPSSDGGSSALADISNEAGRLAELLSPSGRLSALESSRAHGELQPPQPADNEVGSTQPADALVQPDDHVQGSLQCDDVGDESEMSSVSEQADALTNSDLSAADPHQVYDSSLGEAARGSSPGTHMVSNMLAEHRRSTDAGQARRSHSMRNAVFEGPEGSDEEDEIEVFARPSLAASQVHAASSFAQKPGAGTSQTAPSYDAGSLDHSLSSLPSRGASNAGSLSQASEQHQQQEEAVLPQQSRGASGTGLTSESIEQQSHSHQQQQEEEEAAPDAPHTAAPELYEQPHEHHHNAVEQQQAAVSEAGDDTGDDVPPGLYEVTIVTGQRTSAGGPGTEMEVHLTLAGVDGDVGTVLSSVDPEGGPQMFLKAASDTVQMDAGEPVGDITSLQLWHTGGVPGMVWDVERVRVCHMASKATWEFAIKDSIHSDKEPASFMPVALRSPPKQPTSSSRAEAGSSHMGPYGPASVSSMPPQYHDTPVGQQAQHTADHTRPSASGSSQNSFPQQQHRRQGGSDRNMHHVGDESMSLPSEDEEYDQPTHSHDHQEQHTHSFGSLGTRSQDVKPHEDGVAAAGKISKQLSVHDILGGGDDEDASDDDDLPIFAGDHKPKQGPAPAAVQLPPRQQSSGKLQGFLSGVSGNLRNDAKAVSGRHSAHPGIIHDEDIEDVSATVGMASRAQAVEASSTRPMQGPGAASGMLSKQSSSSSTGRPPLPPHSTSASLAVQHSPGAPQRRHGGESKPHGGGTTAAQDLAAALGLSSSQELGTEEEEEDMSRSGSGLSLPDSSAYVPSSALQPGRKQQASKVNTPDGDAGGSGDHSHAPSSGDEYSVEASQQSLTGIAPGGVRPPTTTGSSVHFLGTSRKRVSFSEYVEEFNLPAVEALQGSGNSPVREELSYDRMLSGEQHSPDDPRAKPAGGRTHGGMSSSMQADVAAKRGGGFEEVALGAHGHRNGLPGFRVKVFTADRINAGLGSSTVHMEVLGNSWVISQALPHADGAFQRGCVDRFAVATRAGEPGEVLAIKVWHEAKSGSGRGGMFGLGPGKWCLQAVHIENRQKGVRYIFEPSKSNGGWVACGKRHAVVLKPRKQPINQLEELQQVQKEMDRELQGTSQQEHRRSLMSRIAAAGKLIAALGSSQ